MLNNTLMLLSSSYRYVVAMGQRLCQIIIIGRQASFAMLLELSIHDL